MASILPVFAKHPVEGRLIGRLLAGYGELEISLMLCVGQMIDNPEVALKTLFRTRGESQRIEIADALVRPGLLQGKRRSLFEDTIAGMKFCVQIRNQYAHCNWLNNPTGGLSFVNMEEAAKSHKPLNMSALTTHTLGRALLEEQEAYFLHVQHCLDYLNCETQLKAGRIASHALAEPPKKSRPLLHN